MSAASELSPARRITQSALGFLSVPLFLGVWQLASTSGLVNPLLFPPPGVVAAELYRSALSGLLWADLGMSLTRVGIGYAAGSAAGIAIGLATGRFGAARALLAPVFQLLRPIPPIAFVPIVILWFGLSEFGKWFIVCWGVFFTVWIATHLAVQKTDEGYLRVARCLGTPGWQMLLEVVLPAALPVIFVGLRTAISVSFYTLVAAELAGTFAGVAYRIDVAHQNMQMGQMLGGLVVLGLVSAASDRGFSLLSRTLVFWA